LRRNALWRGLKSFEKDIPKKAKVEQLRFVLTVGAVEPRKGPVRIIPTGIEVRDRDRMLPWII